MVTGKFSETGVPIKSETISYKSIPQSAFGSCHYDASTEFVSVLSPKPAIGP